MIVAVFGSKGGIGKTTIAAVLASEWARRGRKVLIVDTDPQQSALLWGEARSEEGRQGVDTVAAAGNVRDVVSALSERYDFVVIDTPGRDAAVARKAILVADVVLCPQSPAWLDVNTLAQVGTVIEEARGFREDLKVALVLTRLDHRTSEGREARAMFEEADLDLPVIEASLGFRVEFQRALGMGAGPSETQPEGAAAREVSALVEAVEQFGGSS
jgi:chromosome partitioning protein